MINHWSSALFVGFFLQGVCIRVGVHVSYHSLDYSKPSQQEDRWPWCMASYRNRSRLSLHLKPVTGQSIGLDAHAQTQLLECDAITWLLSVPCWCAIQKKRANSSKSSWAGCHNTSAFHPVFSLFLLHTLTQTNTPSHTPPVSQPAFRSSLTPSNLTKLSSPCSKADRSSTAAC